MSADLATILVAILNEEELDHLTVKDLRHLSLILLGTTDDEDEDESASGAKADANLSRYIL